MSPACFSLARITGRSRIVAELDVCLRAKHRRPRRHVEEVHAEVALLDVALELVEAGEELVVLLEARVGKTEVHELVAPGLREVRDPALDEPLELGVTAGRQKLVLLGDEPLSAAGARQQDGGHDKERHVVPHTRLLRSGRAAQSHPQVGPRLRAPAVMSRDGIVTDVGVSP